MFNLIDIGEQAGSGVPGIFNTWEDEGLETPIIKEEFDPDRTILTLSFEKKRRKKQTIKTQAHLKAIEQYLNKVGEARTADIADNIGLSPDRTRVILANMGSVEALGSNRNRTYRLKSDW